MSRFYQYDELARCQPVPLDDISRLAERISELAPFWDGVAVLSGSIAWGEPSWRSDIDVATFRTESFPDIEPMIHKVVKKYKKSMKGRFLIPKVDMIIVGAESQRLVTLTPSRYGPSSEMQTVRDVFASTGLRFFDHIGSLAAIKGEPWRTFHSTYLSQISRDRQTRRNDIRAYVTSFLDTWKQEPLRSLGLDPSRNANQRELDLMDAAESFPIHLMRRILAECSSYPSPDRGCDMHSSFANLSTQWSKNLLEALDPFLHIGEEYAEIVSSCRRKPSLMTAREYNSRLVKLFGGLPFVDVEEVVLSYLSPAASGTDAVLGVSRLRRQASADAVGNTSKEQFRRVLIVGPTGSGKTTVAETLSNIKGFPHIELDRLRYKHDWQVIPISEFHNQVAALVEKDFWIIDGNYSVVRDLTWKHADLVLWLDYPLRVILRRLLIRTAHRLVKSRDVGGGNREQLRRLLGRRSIILWAIRSHSLLRKEYEAAASALRSNLVPRIVRHRSPRETEIWLSRL